MRLKNAVFLILGFSMVVAGLFLALEQAQAAGKKPLNSGASGPPLAGGSCPAPPRSANPVRPVIVQPVGTKAFQLPNGYQVNLQMDFDAIFREVLGANSNFAAVTGGTPDDGCGNHIEIDATVSSFILNATELNLTFGYSPGANHAITNFNGTANVQVGQITMEFEVNKCDSKLCVNVVSSSANQSTAGGSLKFDVNFGLVTTGTDLIVNSPLGEIVRSIMTAGVRSLVDSPNLRELPWFARVVSVDPSKGTFLFDQGFQSRIEAGQGFSVVRPDLNAGACSPKQPVADGHTILVSPVSSSVQIDSTYDPRGVSVGDVVMVK